MDYSLNILMTNLFKNEQFFNFHQNYLMIFFIYNFNKISKFIISLNSLNNVMLIFEFLY